MELGKVIENTRNNRPIVHCITNYVTANECANIILASGGSPIMADEAIEVEDITSISNALVINIGTLNISTIESMIRAGKRANHLGHPVILDPVGVGASALRMETVNQLLQQVKFSVIKGNVSEIKGILNIGSISQGVDVALEDKITDIKSLERNINIAKVLSMQTGAVIAMTGNIDIVVEKDITGIIRNGNSMMSSITGTGCMLSGVIGAFASGNQDNILGATIAAISAMGICGELAYNKIQVKAEGAGSFKTYLMDYMSLMTDEILVDKAKVEIR